MKETFTSIVYEVKIGSTWVNLTPDVEAEPAPAIRGIGIMNTGPLDRVGGAAMLTFSLNNSDRNAARRLGYYTPGNTSGLAGWTTGLNVRVYFVYDGWYKHAFYGKIVPDGIDVQMGQYRRRRVQVTCASWMREAENQTVDLIAYETDLLANAAIAKVIANMPNQPLETSYQSGTRAFPTVFDITSKKTKAYSEFNKIVMSEFGLLYEKGKRTTSSAVAGGVVTFENRTWRYSQRNAPSSISLHSSEALSYLLMETGDKLLLETGDKIYLEPSQEAIFDEGDIIDMRPSYGEHIYNRIKLTSYPRSVDGSPVVLWGLEDPIRLEAYGQMTGIRGAYRDPNGKASSVSGINMIAPVSGTDYAAFANNDGTGTNLTANLTVAVTYGTAEAEYTLTNTGSSAMYVTLLLARGYGVYIYDEAMVQYESAGSISSYGVSELNIDMPYVSNATTLFTAAGSLDLLLMETGDKLLLEDGATFIRCDDVAGVFDLLVNDQPVMYINGATFCANRDKFNMMAFMCLDAGDMIYLSETVTGIGGVYCIHGYDLTIQKGNIVFWQPVLVPATEYPKI